MPVHHSTGDSFSGSLSPLPHKLRGGLIPVAVLGIFSFLAATALLFLLTFRMIQWNRKQRQVNQFIVLIYNLLFADIQQSLAFLLNAQWLVQDGIEVGTSTCWAQGWFVSTGDMGSGVWAFAIGLHTFASVIFGYRLSNSSFVTSVVLLWVFIYGTAVAGVAVHPDLFVRAVAWCWVNSKYSKVRLWLHYFWIFIFEFGTVLVYGAMILMMRIRLSSNFYRCKEQARHAADAAKLMVAYPSIYVICTLPLATLRMYNLRNPDARISTTWFCFAGAMITSNGWMDVLLYTLTRRIELFSDEPPSTDNGLESFGTPWTKPNVFGTETLCEHVPDTPRTKSSRRSDDSEMVFIVDKPYRQRGTNDLLGFVTITESTTVEVKSEPMTNSERIAARQQRDGSSAFPGSDSRSSDYGSTRELWNPHGTNSSPTDDSILTPHSEMYDMESLEFKTKPAGF